MAGVSKVKITFWRVVLAAIMVVGSYAVIIRFTKGLGASTGLSDRFPWGIWIGFDVLCGVALAAGGFTIAACVYIFRLDKFKPILRATVLTAFLGYILAVISLLFDLGHPYRIWHPMIMWNEHSPMFEVAWCVMLYTTVLALEFSPVVFERFNLKGPLRIIHGMTLPIVIVGVLLSTLHQSTLGTLFVIVPNKLHGLWYTPLLPVLFYVSAISVGLSMVIFESSLSHRAFGTSLHKSILSGLSKAIVWVLSVYLALKLITLGVRGNMGLIFEGSAESYLYILEMTMGVILPIILFSMRRVRQSQQGLFYSSLLVVLGLVINRLNVSITGIERYSGNAYFPSFLEVMTTVFVIACGFIAFGVITRYFPVFPASHEDEHSYAPLAESAAPRHASSSPGIATPAGLVALVVIAAIFLGIAYSIRLSQKPEEKMAVTASSAVAASMRKIDVGATEGGLALPPDYVFPKGEGSPGSVVFSHEKHIGEKGEACTNCHPRPYKMASLDVATSECEYGRMSGCGYCHDGSRAFDVQGECRTCHSPGPVALGANFRLSRKLSDFTMPSVGRAVGPVIFSHRLHVLGENLACGDCHPKTYRMTRTPAPDPKMVSATKHMKWGHKCRNCHDGSKAFEQVDNCGRCHST